MEIIEVTIYLDLSKCLKIKTDTDTLYSFRSEISNISIWYLTHYSIICMSSVSSRA